MLLDYPEIIQKLKQNNPDFKKLTERYELLTTQIQTSTDEDQIIQLSKDQLALGNEINTILKKII